MTLISLICLLALSSSAFGRSTYGSSSYGELPRGISLSLPKQDLLTTPSLPVQQPWMSQTNTLSSGSYGQQHQKPVQSLSLDQQTMTQQYQKPIQSLSYDQQLMTQQYQKPVQSLSFDQQTMTQQLTQADILCQGQRPETILPLDEGRRFIVCLDDGKGTEQTCPRGLHFHQETRRCERRLGALDNACSSNPCLNEGQCLPVDTSSYQCKCAPGFDGYNCELDARICQTQQPCGSSPGVRCQSFRSNAALQYICLYNKDLAYGFNAQQVIPSPCRNIDGAQPLSITDKGFIMCDGERMFIESCPGGTIWDDSTKACVWPDMQGAGSSVRLNEQIKSTGYSQEKPSYSSSYESQSQLQRPVLESTFSTPASQLSFPITQKLQWKSQDMIQTPVSSSSYGNQQWTQTPSSSYGNQQWTQTPVSSLNNQQQWSQNQISSLNNQQQWTQKPEQLIQKSQQLVQKPMEFIQKPTEFVQRPELMQKPSEFVQSNIQKPSEFFQQSTEFTQRPTEFNQRPIESIQKQEQFIQKPVQKMQDFLPTQSFGGQSSFQTVQRQPETQSFQGTSAY